MSINVKIVDKNILCQRMSVECQQMSTNVGGMSANVDRCQICGQMSTNVNECQHFHKKSQSKLRERIDILSILLRSFGSSSALHLSSSPWTNFLGSGEILAACYAAGNRPFHFWCWENRTLPSMTNSQSISTRPRFTTLILAFQRNYLLEMIPSVIATWEWISGHEVASRCSISHRLHVCPLTREYWRLVLRLVTGCMHFKYRDQMTSSTMNVQHNILGFSCNNFFILKIPEKE